MNEQQWEEIRIEDVKPGDVARCGQQQDTVREVIRNKPDDAVVRFTNYDYWFNAVAIASTFGITFWRKVKREPRVFCGFVTVLRRPLLYGSGSIPCAQVLMPDGWEHGARVRITEILDGEDGA